MLCITALIWKDIAAFSWNIWFYNNQVILAEKYCENKDKPMLHCNGKCYLAKKLQKLEQEETQNQPVPKMPLKLVEVAIFSPLTNLVPLHTSSKEKTMKKGAFRYTLGNLTSFQSKIFHPPTLG